MLNKVAIVSGGTGGLGTAICQTLAKEYQVIAIYYKNNHHAVAIEWQQRQKDLGFHFEILCADLRCFASCADIVNLIIERYRRIDVLVNNAGVTADASLKNMQQEQWHYVIDSNLNAVFNLTKQVLPHMLTQESGRIISISSVNGRKGQFGQCNYAASKSALYGFTKSLAQELAKKGITVNCISPGYIQTAMLERLDPKILTQIIEGIPVGRLGRPEEVASVVEFLAKDSSSFITGANIDINGGQYFG